MKRVKTIAWTSLLALAAAFSVWPGHAKGNQGPSPGWEFAVSGDSRNCGDVVMPGIVAQVKKTQALFYWHLGDFRKITGVDEDIQHQPAYAQAPLNMPDYEAMAWGDFVKSQVGLFGDFPVFLSIGNHETAKPKTRDDYVRFFAKWLDEPILRKQRLADDPNASAPKSYYHWMERGVDFIVLDNATPDEFTSDQVDWFERVLQRDSADKNIHTLVVGMHEALPESVSEDHSMAQSEQGVASGRRVYGDLLRVKDGAHKYVYVLASHSHYFAANIFNTPYWKAHGGVLPAWIVGTAGAVRYALPPETAEADVAQTNVYGFLLATVHPDGTIDFSFRRLDENGTPPNITKQYSPAFVHWCFAENSEAVGGPGGPGR